MYHRTLAVLAFLLLPTAGAGSTVGSRLPTQDGEPVTGFSETALGRPGHELYLRNNTSSPITITSLTLFECENIRGRCRVRDVEWVLDPGEVRRALVVEPRDQARAWNYRWRWTFSRGTAAAPPSAAARPSATRPAPEPIVLEESDEARVLLDPRGRFVNVVLPQPVMEELRTGPWEREKGMRISRILYRSLRDVFDFVFLAFPARESMDLGRGPALTTRTRVHTEGLGLGGQDLTSSFGSAGRLMAVIVMSRHENLGAPMPLHEIAHLWGQRVLPVSDDPGAQGHMGFAEGGGALGGWPPGTLEEVGGGLWAAPTGPSGPAPSFLYSPLELYLMGLLPPDSVPPFQVAEDAEWVTPSEGLFRASGIKTVTVGDLIATHGPRVPGFPEAPREFRGVYVIVSSTPLDAGTRNSADENLADLARPGPRELRSFPNFWEATEGRGRLILDGLVEALITP